MTATDCTIFTRKMTTEDARMEITKASGTCSSISQLRAVAALCNAGEFDASTISAPLKERIIQGDATDQAILRFAEGLGPVSEMRGLWRKRFDLAFNSKNKFMIRVFSLSAAEGLAQTVDGNEASSFAQSGDM
jgi:magnesium-transporting ATPase (P-type)